MADQDWQAAFESKNAEFEQLQADYADLEKTFTELQEELEQVCSAGFRIRASAALNLGSSGCWAASLE